MKFHAVKVRSVCLAILHFSVLLSLVFLALPAQATIYKCVDGNGNTTYSGTACATDESARKITTSATPVTAQDCRIAHNFSLAISKQLKRGESSGAVFDSFGGMNSLSPSSIGLISYIYTFKGNDHASVNRIANLATERCEIGSFGAAASYCNAYPNEYIESMGGCNAALGGPRFNQPDLGAATASPSGPYPTDENTDNSNAANIAAIRAREARAALEVKQECRDRINENIANNAQSMRKSLPVRAMELLRTRHRNLRNQLNRC